MKAGEYLKKKLEDDYLGKSIYTFNKSNSFIVYKITVEDGGVDPQWQILFTSKQYEEVNSDCLDRRRSSNFNGYSPSELIVLNENHGFCWADDDMPEIVISDENKPQ